MTSNITISIDSMDKDAQVIFINKFKRFLTLMPEYKFRVDADDQLTLFYTETEVEFLPPEYLPEKPARNQRRPREFNKSHDNTSKSHTKRPRSHYNRSSNLFGV